MIQQFAAWLTEHPIWADLFGLAALAVGSYLVYLIVKYVVLKIVEKIVAKTPFTWDDVFKENRVFARLSLLAPAATAYHGVALIPDLHPTGVLAVQRLSAAAAVMIFVVAANAALRSANEIYQKLPSAKTRPIKGYVQIVQILVSTAGVIVFVATLIGESPWLFMSGIGAMTAVLMLVFKDTLLSLVASVQLTSNDMIRVGDWIEVPHQNADGFVIDIALHVVKVENWDKTVTTIPTYALISHGFKNWRTMYSSGGRRIKRSLFIDMTSVRHLSDEEIAMFEGFHLLRDYLAGKKTEIAEYNAKHAGRSSARRLTNVGTFRAYIHAYLKNHPGINQEMYLLVRQLAPTPTGLPIEIYAFTSNTSWDIYEGVQADVFDHLLAIAPDFGLHIYQQPSGVDLRQVALPRVLG